LGFSGGGSNILLPHTHDGTVAQDGGPLDFDNVTQADLTAGDVVFSDGTHLQRLAIGTPAQQIQVNAGATAPEYFTPAGASATWTELANVKLTANGNLVSGTFAVHDYLYVIIYGGLVTPSGQALKFNNDTASGTKYVWSDVRNGAWAQFTAYACWQYGFGSTSNLMSMNCWIQNGTAHDRTVNKLGNWNRVEQTGPTSASAVSQDLGVGMWVDTNAITSIQVCNDAGTTSPMLAGSQMIVLGLSP